jgi:hypothetical protein
MANSKPQPNALRLKRYGYSSQWPAQGITASKRLMAKTKTTKRTR